jgi:hypothetical protein
MKENKILLNKSFFAIVFFSSFNLKGKFLLFFLHTSFFCFVYLYFYRLKHCSNEFQRLYSETLQLVSRCPHSTEWKFKKPVFTLTYRELSPDEV